MSRTVLSHSGAGEHEALAPRRKHRDERWEDGLRAKLTRNMSPCKWCERVAPDIGYKCRCPSLPITPDDPAGPVAEACTGGPAQPMFP